MGKRMRKEQKTKVPQNRKSKAHNYYRTEKRKAAITGN